MRQTIALAFIFVGVASLIAFTSTDVFTLFARQHTFVNISFAGNDISCVDCHHSIQNELNNSAFHNDLSCEDCHRFTGTGITFASGDNASATPGKEAHAAYTPRCLDCHGGSGTLIDSKFAPPAPAFNETDYGSEFSAHKPLVKQSLAFNLSVGENEACLACQQIIQSILNSSGQDISFSLGIRVVVGSHSQILIMETQILRMF